MFDLIGQIISCLSVLSLIRSSLRVSRLVFELNEFRMALYVYDLELCFSVPY